MVKKIFISLVCLTLCGCMCPQQQEEDRQDEIRRYFELNLNLPDILKDNIMNRRVILGMTREQVLLCWGSAEVNRSVGSWGVHEQWVYSAIYGPYLYFENGILTSFQD